VLKRDREDWWGSDDPAPGPSPERPRWDVVRVVTAAVLGAVLVFGIAVRVHDPMHSMAWFDEVSTSMLSSGHTLEDVRQLTNRPTPISVEDFQQRLLVPSPSSSVLADVRTGLRADAHQAPVYFLLVRLAFEVWDDPKVPGRVVSSAASVLLLPCLFWLAWELFGRRAALLAVCLAAVSPQQVLFAFTSRPYSLWGAAICFSSAALVHALRRGGTRAWILYALSLGWLFNTHLLSLAVVAVHVGMAALIGLRSASWKTARSFLAALAFGVATALPWWFVLWTERSASEIGLGWISEVLPLSERLWLLYKHLFIQLFTTYYVTWGGHRTAEGLWETNTTGWWIGLASLGLVVLAVSGLLRRGPRASAIFVVALLLAAPLLMGTQDLVWGGRRLALGRYLEPTMIAILLAVAWFFAERRRGVPQFVAGLVLMGGLAVGSWTSWVQSRAPSPANKPNMALIPMAEMIGTGTDPLVVSPALVNTPLVLALLLPPESDLLFLRETSDLGRIEQFGRDRDIFVIDEVVVGAEPFLPAYELLREAIPRQFVSKQLPVGLMQISLAPTTDLPTPKSEPILVDDFDDGDDQNAFGESTAVYAPEGSSISLWFDEPGLDGSAGAAYIRGTSGIPPPTCTITLENNGVGVDLSMMQGLRFRTRGDGKRYAVRFHQEKTPPNWDDHGQVFVAPSDTWASIEVPLDAVEQEGWNPQRWDPTNIRSLRFNPIDPGPFELAIDEVEFY